ncbi:MopE-related protein, partial [Flavobacterium sp.]|uniref:MopE-related protein n=1 Tax=Flavobacterium sp. TaxID=239 RepID=UPI0037537407
GTVVSMFTGTPPVYANVVNAVRAPWTAGTQLSTIANGADTCLQVDNFGYLGYITDGANFSAAGMTKLHVDVYLNTPIANMFIYLLSNGDQLYNTGALTAGWNSIDIPLSTFPGANLSDIYGFKFEHNQGAARQIYLDNIYFYVAGSDPVITGFTVPAKVFGDAPFMLTAPTSNSAGAFTYTSSNLSVATISGSTVTVTGIGTSTITAVQAADGSFDAGSTTASLVVSAPPLAVAAPTPPVRNTYDVVSLYSDAYTNLPSAMWQGASSLTDEVIAGNPSKKLSNFIVEFINFAATDVSQMTMLHMDVYTPDVTGFNIWLLNNGDRNAQFFPTLNGWYSVDIPLSTYVNNGLNMTGISQLKFEGLNGPGKTVYVDNVYFYRPATLPPATVGMFTVPAKNVGDANFAITPPTSNNTSPFTYTSSNTNVATIVGGNQISIVTGGTTTITASQVTDGTYGPTSRTATFVVSFPAPGPSPIPPARQASRVMSMYTGTPSVYANNPLYTTVRSFWTGATSMTEVQNGTNTALKVDNLGFIGLIDQSERRLNVTGMTNLHLDVYVNAPFANLFFWLLTDGDQRRDITNLVAGWNSINIDLTEFAGANLSNVYGLKFEQNTPNALQIYLDNIYFSNDTHYTDADGDGYGNLSMPVVGQPAGSVLDATDCDDANANVNPGRPEVAYNGIDDNCDGNFDEGFPAMITSLTGPTCGSTLSNNFVAVHATQVPGASGYRFRVTNMTSNSVQIIDR